MWIYEQALGRISHNNATLCMGYAGKGDGKNNPAMQNIPFIGPLPCGDYTIGAPYDSPHTGDYTLPLTPNPANEMFGRNEFKIHGDSIEHPGEASDGCVIAALYARKRIWESGDRDFRVVEVLPAPPDAAWPNAD